MTPEQHAQFLGALDEALETAIRRYRALHHASLAELQEMQKEVNEAKEALDQAVAKKVDSVEASEAPSLANLQETDLRSAVG